MKFYPYWWEDYKPYHFQNCSINNQTYDLVIIGSGYTGICAAQESVSKNLKNSLDLGETQYESSRFLYRENSNESFINQGKYILQHDGYEIIEIKE